MQRTLKWLLMALFSLFTLVLLLILTLVLFVDLNSLKPRIEQLAAEKAGLDLRIPGELGWSFYPYLGISIGELQLRPLATPDDEPLAQMQQAGFGIALLPLLSGEVRISRIHLIQPEVLLQRDAQGIANWERVQESLATTTTETTATPESGTTATAPEASTPLTLYLAIDDIWLDRARVRVQDPTANLDLELSDVSLRIRDVQLEQAFPLSLTANLKLADPALSLNLQLDSQIRLNLTDEIYQLNQLQARLLADYPALLKKPATIALNLDLLADLARQEVQLQSLLQLDQLALNLEAQVSQVLEAPQFAGSLKLELPELRKLLQDFLNITLPEMQDATTLSRTALDLRFSGDLERLLLPQLDLTFDSTQFKGQAAVDLEKLAIFLRVAGDALDADRYLPPSADAEQTVASTGDTPTSDDELLPVELLRTLDLDIGLTLDQLTLKQLKIEKIDLALKAQDGLVDLQRANLDLYEGQFRTRGQIDVRPAQPRLALNTQLQQLNLQPLLADLELQSVPLRGNLNLNGDFTTQGTRLSEWLAGSNGVGNLRLNAGAITGVNVSKEVCTVAASLEGHSSEREWGPDTEFTSLQADIKLVNGKLNNDDLRIAIPGFEVSGLGYYHLVAQDFFYNLGIRFTTDADQQACRVSTHLAQVRWPVECKGSLAGDAPSISCRPDTAAVTGVVGQMLKDAAQREADALRSQAEARAKAEADALQQRAEEALRQRQQEERLRLEEQARDRLRSLTR